MRTWDHVLPWSNKEIGGRHGTHHVFAMWKEVGACR